MVAIIDELENAIKQAVQPLLEGGSTLPGINIGKDAVNRGNLNDKNAVKQMLDVLESKNKLIQK